MLAETLPARWVQVENGLVIHVLSRHNRLDDVLHQILVNFVICYICSQPIAKRDNTDIQLVVMSYSSATAVGTHAVGKAT